MDNSFINFNLYKRNADHDNLPIITNNKILLKTKNGLIFSNLNYINLAERKKKSNHKNNNRNFQQNHTKHSRNFNSFSSIYFILVSLPTTKNNTNNTIWKQIL